MRAPDKPTAANRVEQQRVRKNRNVKEHRARKRKGLDVYSVAADVEALNLIVRLDYIADRQTLDKQLVNRAISALLWDLAHGRLKVSKPVSSTHVWTG